MAYGHKSYDTSVTGPVQEAISGSGGDKASISEGVEASVIYFGLRQQQVR